MPPVAAACRWPLADLLDATHQTRTGLARQLGCNGNTMLHAHTHGLTTSQADRWAVRTGHHPANIWADWYTPTAGQAA